MRRLNSWLILVLCCALLSGCMRENFHPLDSGYGIVIRDGVLPHMPWTVELVFDGGERRHSVWKSLAAGYGGPFVHGDLVVFAARLPERDELLQSLHLFASTSRSLPADLSEHLFARALAKAGIDGIRTSGFRAEGELGIVVQFAILDARGNSKKETIDISLSWSELEELVKRSAGHGVRLNSGGSEYYKCPPDRPNIDERGAR